MKTNARMLAWLPLLAIAACGQGTGNKPAAGDKGTAATDSALLQTAREAWLFGLPLVLMDISRRQATDAGSAMHSPPNTFSHISFFPDASFRNIVRPNADTYYSSAWLELGTEPIVLSVPDTKGRYYLMPMLDAWTNVFASPGKRTTGTQAGNFLITGPNWTGNVPADMKQIKAPTDLVWIIGRTQVNSKADGDKVVVPLQKQYKLTPLSSWGKTYKPVTPAHDTKVPKGSPNDIVENMPVEEFFNYLNRLMVDNPPAAADKAVMDRFVSLGIKPGGRFSLGSFSPAVQEALKKLPAETVASIKGELSPHRKPVNGWSVNMTGPMGNYGTDYRQRAGVAYNGLGANLKEDAVYPSCSMDAEGKPLDGANNYVLHFDKGQSPPATAFWSLTMYGPDGYMVKNPINRNAIGDRDKLEQNADGSTDIYIQHLSPGKDKESNWLPAPAGSFNLLLRVYWPKEEMLNGSWQIPPVRKVP